jgi:hypothetical protein
MFQVGSVDEVDDDQTNGDGRCVQIEETHIMRPGGLYQTTLGVLWIRVVEDAFCLRAGLENPYLVYESYSLAIHTCYLVSLMLHSMGDTERFEDLDCSALESWYPGWKRHVI